MLQKRKFLPALVILVVVSLCSVNQGQGAVSIVATTTAGVNTLSNNDTYEKSIAVSVSFTPTIDIAVENVTNPVIKFYAQQQGQSLILASTTKDASTFANATEQSKTATLYIDEESVAGQKLVSDAKVVVWAKIYNETVSEANYLGGDATTVDYGVLVNTDSDSTSESSYTFVDYAIFAGLFIALVIGVVVIFGIIYVKGKEMLD